MFKEEDHPRLPKGNPAGGEFTGKNEVPGYIQKKIDLPVDESVLMANSKFASRKDIIENEKDPSIYPELSTIEKTSIYHYSADGFGELNDYLRGKKSFNTDTEFLDNFSNSLENATNKIQAVYKGEVYRGVSLPEKDLKNLKVGEIYSTPAFLSTTTTKGIYKGNTEFVINSKNGKVIQPFSKYGVKEKEILFNRKAKFNITSVEDNNGVRIVKMNEF